MTVSVYLKSSVGTEPAFYVPFMLMAAIDFYVTCRPTSQHTAHERFGSAASLSDDKVRMVKFYCIESSQLPANS